MPRINIKQHGSKDFQMIAETFCEVAGFSENLLFLCLRRQLFPPIPFVYALPFLCVARKHSKVVVCKAVDNLVYYGKAYQKGCPYVTDSHSPDETSCYQLAGFTISSILAVF